MDKQQLDLPRLEPPFDRALDDALAYVVSRFDPAGIVVSGTIVRGNPDAESDLDIFVVHHALLRQRVQRRFRACRSRLGTPLREPA
jgi:predicted nucleotidyltransferase